MQQTGPPAPQPCPALPCQTDSRANGRDSALCHISITAIPSGNPRPLVCQMAQRLLLLHSLLWALRFVALGCQCQDSSGFLFAVDIADIPPLAQPVRKSAYSFRPQHTALRRPTEPTFALISDSPGSSLSLPDSTGVPQQGISCLPLV